MRKALVVSLSLIASLFGAAPAVAEPEPDNWIWQATGPVTSGSITGTIASNNDDDWYMFYAASQTQLVITMQKNNCGWNLETTLRDTNGSSIDSEDFSTSIQTTIKYTTPAGTKRYFLEVTGSTCSTPYQISLSPVASLVAGPSMPTATTPTGEPNESAQQAAGPLAGDTIYTGKLETQNDQDWFVFYANAAFTVEATEGGGCYYTDVTLLAADQNEIDSTSTSANWYSHISYTPTAWNQYYLKIGPDEGCAYRFSISPASAIQAGPAPAPTAPAPMTGLTYRKTKKSVVVYWPGIAGATGYQVRVRKGSKWRAWKSTANTWKSYKRTQMPRTMSVQARAINAVGAGAAQTIKARVRR